MQPVVASAPPLKACLFPWSLPSSLTLLSAEAVCGMVSSLKCFSEKFHCLSARAPTKAEGPKRQPGVVSVPVPSLSCTSWPLTPPPPPPPHSSPQGAVWIPLTLSLCLTLSLSELVSFHPTNQSKAPCPLPPPPAHGSQPRSSLLFLPTAPASCSICNLPYQSQLST